MGQITVTISDENQRALEAEAEQRGVPIDAVVDERLIALAGSREERLTRFFDAASANWQKSAAEMTDDEALEFAVQEVRAYRREKRERENGPANSNP
ncbi:MAG: hypothetical protein WD557_06805 [Dehalococcoidia bacterium]